MTTSPAAPTPWSAIAVPLAFVRVSFLSMLAYRLRFYTGIVTYLIYVAVYTSIWKAVYHDPASRGALAEFGSFDTLFTYFAIGWIARSFTFNNIDRDLAELVETGHVASRVAKPVSLHVQMISAALGQTLFRLTCFTPLIAVALVLIWGLRPPASPAAFLLFLGSLGLGIVILAEVNFLVGLLAFKTKSIQGITHAKQTMVEILSGLLVPLSYFPDALERIALWTPFPTLTSIPNRLYLGLLTGADAGEALAFSAAWCVGLVVAAHLAGKAVSRSLTIQGG